MAAESSPSSSTSVPPFSCRINGDLLEGLNDKDRRFYVQMDATDQKIDWLLNHAVGQATTLEGVLKQTTATNGKVLAAQADIVTLKESTAPVVRAYGLASAAARSKWGWAGAGVMVFFVLPWLAAHAPNPADFFKLVLGF